MYDGIGFIFSSAICPPILRSIAHENWRHCLPGTDDPVTFAFAYGLLHYRYSSRTQRVTVDGSLHRYYTQQGNDTKFTLSQVREAIGSLAHTLEFAPQFAEVKHLEIGLNIPVECPEAIIRAAVLFKGVRSGDDEKKKRFRGKKWSFEDYEVKLYLKGKKLLRFEIHINRMRHLPFDIQNLADLCSAANGRLSLNYLKDQLKYFVFVPDKGDLPLTYQEHIEWMTLRDQDNWADFSKDQKCRRIAWVREMIESHRMIDWMRYLEDRIVSQIEEIIDVQDEIDATFSKLGLLSETVAGAEGERDRRAENVLIIEQEDTIISSGKGVRNNSRDFLDILHLIVESRMPFTMSIFKEIRYLNCSCLLKVFVGVLEDEGFRIGGRGPPVKGSLTLSLGVFFPLQIRIKCSLGDPSCLDYVRDRDFLCPIQCECLLDGLGVSLGPSAFAAAGAGGGEAVPGSLRDQVALELAHAGCDSE